MTRAEFERVTAAGYVPPKTVAEMGAAGYYSAVDPSAEGCGWQSFAIPPDATPGQRSAVLRDFHDMAPRRFGAAAP